MGYKNNKVRRGIAYIATDDHVFDTFTKTARRKYETHVESAILCKAQRNFEKKTLVHPMSTSRGRTLCADALHAHKIDAYESRRCRINESGKQKHEEHIADCVNNSSNLYNMVHLPKPIPNQ